MYSTFNLNIKSASKKNETSISLNVFPEKLHKFFLTVVIIVFFVILPLNSAFAQVKNIRFKHLTINDGLSQSWVHSIIQDKYGFIWIGTEDGLNRFDGNSFYVYKNNLRNKYSISSNSIMTIYEDSRGNMWIATRRGLNRFDREKNRFIRYPRWADHRVWSIAEDDDKNLWIGASVGLYRFDLKNDSVSVYSPDNAMRGDESRLLSGGMQIIFVDSKKNVWIGSTDGLHLYDKGKNIFHNYYHDKNNLNSISSDDIRSIAEDKDGRLWVGTSTGLDLFTNFQEHPRKGIFAHYMNSTDDQSSISRGAVLSLMANSNHQLWIGIENSGLDLLDLNDYKKGKHSFIHFRNDPNKGTSLSNNSVYSLFQDKQGNVWIGTFGDGLNIMNPLIDKFNHVKSEPGNKNTLSNDQVNVFLEENDFLWIGTEGGLNRYQKKNNTFKHYVYNPRNNKSIGSNAIWSICKDRQGNLWIGTWGGGLNKFDYKTETFEHYYYDPDDTNSLGSNNIFSIYEDSKGVLWIGTMGGGLNMFDRGKNKFIRYNISNSGIRTNFVSAVIETRNGDFWIADEISFERFDRRTKVFEHFTYDPNDSTSLNSNKAISIFEDSKGNLWLGTDNGLTVYDGPSKGFKYYQIEDGLPSNTINSILEDNHGNLWCGTDKGLSEFINGINLPAKPEFRNYVYEDGLQSNEFGRRSCLKDTNGTLYFGGTNGFNIFNPNKITENTFVPPIVITDFKIFNKSMLVDEEDSPLKKGIIVTKDIILSYKQSNFSFDFAALNYISSSKNQFAYMMEGFDKGWIYIGTKRTATYTNLSSGDYVFRVKGSNNDNVWNEEGTAIRITITPPIWQTIWFKIAILIVAVGFGYWIYKWRMQARDFAAQKRLDTALARERNLLRTLIDNWPDYIYIKDLESRFMISNAAFIRRFGFSSEEELIGKTDFDLFPHKNAEKFFEIEQKIIQSGEGFYDSEGPAEDAAKEEKNIWVSTTKVPLRDTQGNIVGTIGIGRDVTARKKSETEREQLITELQNALNDIKTLSGLVPICANCKKIRDDQGYWTQLEAYIQDRSDAKFTHSICPDCAAKLYPNYNMKKQ